jgi:transcription elongation factor GreB
LQPHRKEWWTKAPTSSPPKGWPRSKATSPASTTVTITRKGRTQTFRIVGVDEVDAAHGLISFRSPLAQAILGAQPGDIIDASEPLGEIEISVVK